MDTPTQPVEILTHIGTRANIEHEPIVTWADLMTLPVVSGRDLSSSLILEEVARG